MGEHRSRYTPVIAILTYILFAAWLTWPALGSLGVAIPGNEGDALVHLWTYDWVKDALRNGQSPYFTDRLFYPQGVELYTHNFAWLNITMWLPLQAMFGGSAAYTLVYLIILVFNGSAVFFLVRHLTGNDEASFLAGFIVTGWPYIITRFSQPNLIFIAVVPLALLAMHRLTVSRRWTDVLWLGLAVAGIGFSRYQMLIMSAPLLVLAGFYWLWQVDAENRGKTLMQLVAGAGLALLLLAPIAGPVVRFATAREFTADILGEDRSEWGEADLLGYFLPGDGAPLVGPLAAQRFPNLLTHTPIGLVTLGLAILGLFSPRRDKWLWLGMALLLLLMALGRELTFNGQVLMALPFAWLEDHFFLVQVIRYPSRFSALLAVPVAVLAGYGLLLLSRSRSPVAAWVLTAALAILIALGYRVPDYPLLDLETPAWYEQLAVEEGAFGLVTIPLTRTFDEFAMAYQLTHDKPLVQGHVSRPPREAFDFIKDTPFLANLREQWHTPPVSGNISGQLRPLAQNNLRYVVIHKRFLTPEQVSQWRRWMGVAPFHEDDELLVYATAAAREQDFLALQTAVPGLAFVAGQLYPHSISATDTAAAITHWSVEPGTARNWTGCYELSDGQGNVVEEQCQELALPPMEDSERQLVRVEQELTAPAQADESVYQVGLRLQAEEGLESDRFDLGPLYINSEGRQFNAPDPETPLDVRIGPTLALVGFDGPRIVNQNLDLTLFWQAVEETDISYKIYIHAFDANSGELVGQLDTVPHNWDYPTNAWRAGEYVSDRLSLSIPGTAPEAVSVEIGVYHPDTGERLAANDADGNPFENNNIPLATIETQ